MDIKWKIVEQDFANFELINTKLRVAAGDAGDNYLCGNCGYLLAEKIPRGIKDRLGIYTVRCPSCKQSRMVLHSITMSHQTLLSCCILVDVGLTS